MLRLICSIAQNTFLESIRQPIITVVLGGATIMLVLSVPLSAFTLDDDQKMLIDIGLATVFVAGVILAAFIATSVLGREIESKTALTVVSKPVPRPAFVIGKFIGALGAIQLSVIFMIFVFMIVESHAVMQTVRDPIHIPAIVFGAGSIIIGIISGIWCNLFYGFVFSSTTVIITTPALGFAYFLTLNFGPDFTSQNMNEVFEPNLWKGSLVMMGALTVLTAIAVALSVRFGALTTLIGTLSLFLTGLLSDWLFGRKINSLENRWLDEATANDLTTEIQSIRILEKTNGEIDEITSSMVVPIEGINLIDFASSAEYISWLFLQISNSLIPNFQMLWLADALTQYNVIPNSYLVLAFLYTLIYTSAALSFGVFLFQRREVG